MCAVKPLLDCLLWDIYGKQHTLDQYRSNDSINGSLRLLMCDSVFGFQRSAIVLNKLNVQQLLHICDIMRLELRLISYLLKQELILRDRNRRHQKILCSFVTAILHVLFLCLLHGYYDDHPKMLFSLSPPASKADSPSDLIYPAHCENVDDWSLANSLNNNSRQSKNPRSTNMHQAPEHHGDVKNGNVGSKAVEEEEEVSDYVQWLHAMKLVARLPGGVPSEFRRKLWLSLAEKYLKSKNIDWNKEEEKCFCEEWREDDEELGIQIVKDLHRTGSTLCTGPAGDINQAKLKRVLLGYARFNPEVGYCQGFNMLGALILEVMDKVESESIKVMIYLVEGVLPAGYFCGSMGGLQADMAAFRELMQTKLPRLAKHLQKLQGPIENAFEPPLTNVFTMQWFLTMFCTCLPMISVLRVWDLVLIEGSEVILRTALVLWSILEERILTTRSADEFYGKMASFSSELLKGHLTNSNGLIERIVDFGPIVNIQKLRDKHLYNVTPLSHGQGLQIYYDDDEAEIDDESRLAVATFWGFPWPRRASTTSSFILKHTSENRERIALDISLLKKKYDRLRERQKQAHVIFTSAYSTARQINTMTSIPVNHLLLGQTAIVTNKGRRSGPRLGSIPPLRKPSLPAILQTKQNNSSAKCGETLHWRETNFARSRHDSLTWKEIKAERAALCNSGSMDDLQSQKLRARPLGKSDSSSYSEDSDKEGNYSSTDTSLCDDEESSKLNEVKRRALASKSKAKASSTEIPISEHERPKSWAASSNEIPFVLMATESPTHSGDEKVNAASKRKIYTKTAEGSNESDYFPSDFSGNIQYTQMEYSQENPPAREDENIKNLSLANEKDEPAANLKEIFNSDSLVKYDAYDKGVINQYFEYINDVERPSKVDLRHSISDDSECISIKYKAFEGDGEKCQNPSLTSQSHIGKPNNELEDHTKTLKQTYNYTSSMFKDGKSAKLHNKIDITLNSEASKLNRLRNKRKDPRRLTITKSINESEDKMPTKRLSLPPNCDFTKYQSNDKSIEEVASHNSLNNGKSVLSRVHPTNRDIIDRKALYNQRNSQKAISEILRKSSTYDGITGDQQTLSKSPTKSETADIPKDSENGITNQRNSKDKKNRKDEHTITENTGKSGRTAVTPNNLPRNDSAKDKQTERFRRIPSTAELEDRFNALEMHTEKMPALVKAKKPPDESKVDSKEEKQNTKSEDDNTSKTAEHKEQEDVDKPSDDNMQQRKSSVTVKDEFKARNESEKTSPEQLSRQKPPSTEELEKRFLALEKRMSSVGYEDEQKNNTKKTKEEPSASGETSKRKEIKSVENEKCDLTKDSSEEGPESKENIHSNPKTQATSVKDIEKTKKRSANATQQHTAEEEDKNTKDDDIEDLSEKPVRPTESLRDEVEKSQELKEENTKDTKVKKAVKEKLKSDTESKTQPQSSKRPTTRKEIVDVQEKKSLKFDEQPANRESQTAERRSSTPVLSTSVNPNADLHKRRMSHKVNDMEFLMKSHEVLKHVEDIVKNVSEEYQSINKRIRSNEADDTLLDTDKTNEEEKITNSSSEKNVNQKKAEDLQKAEIPEPPPFTSLPIETKALMKDPQQRALIEELQQKVSGLVGDSNLKPSTINPKRKPIRDVPSEKISAHAFYRMKNYEPLTGFQKPVRRFSDLPSRADLENRLEYLEQRLNHNLQQQNAANENASTSKVQSVNNDLEVRVRALEKQLSENSLQVLQAIQNATALNASVKREVEPSTSNIAITGKELVKYAYPDEVDETKPPKPINISINIKMVLNKDVCDVEHLECIEMLPKVEDSDKHSPVLDPSDFKEEQPAEMHAGENVCSKSDAEEVVELQDEKEAPQVTEPVEPLSTTSHETPFPAELTQTIDNDKEESKRKDSTHEEEIKCQEQLSTDEITSTDALHTQQENAPEPAPEVTNIEENLQSVQNATNIVHVKQMHNDENTLVLLMNDESKAMKVRRLTRANTQELEGLFQALETQLIERNLIKSEDGKLMHADKSDQKAEAEAVPTKEAKAISELSKEIVEFTKNQELNDPKQTDEVDFDWGSDPVKHHLKRRTVHLPSTKELEARFRSLERQIKLLEDVEKIDVEQRLSEIERKIKLQYSLAHETNINKFLELCEGKYLDEELSTEKTKAPDLSSRKKLTKEQISQTTFGDINTPTMNDLNYRYRALNLKHSKSKENLSGKSKKKKMAEKQPVHLLEMLLDTSPDSDILPTTGELEHRFHNLERNSKDSSQALLSLSQERLRSPSPVSYKNKIYDDSLKSPSKRKLPTAADLEARLMALEQKRNFLQKDFTEFNQNLMDVVSPSILLEGKNLEVSTRQQRQTESADDLIQSSHQRAHKPSSVRFENHRNSNIIERRAAAETMVSKSSDVLQIIKENSKMLDRILKKTLADSSSKLPEVSSTLPSGSVSFSSIHLRRETSPLQRSGTYTGIPLRTSENIGERLSSIKTSIKHIDSLCEEKPYNKEKCLQYIDSLCSNSTHFMSKQNSLDNLNTSRSDRSLSRSDREVSNQSVHITDYGKSFTRSMGSIEGRTYCSPQRSPIEPQYRSSRDLREHISPKQYSANAIDHLQSSRMYRLTE